MAIATTGLTLAGCQKTAETYVPNRIETRQGDTKPRASIRAFSISGISLSKRLDAANWHTTLDIAQRDSIDPIFGNSKSAKMGIVINPSTNTPSYVHGSYDAPGDMKPILAKLASSLGSPSYSRMELDRSGSSIIYKAVYSTLAGNPDSYSNDSYDCIDRISKSNQCTPYARGFCVRQKRTIQSSFVEVTLTNQDYLSKSPYVYSDVRIVDTFNISSDKLRPSLPICGQESIK